MLCIPFADDASDALARHTMSFESRYRKFDNLYDSDEEKQKSKGRGPGAARSGAASKRAVAPPSKPKAGPMTDPDPLGSMPVKQREAMLNEYAKMFNKTPKKPADYKFPDTIEEQRVICDAAEEFCVQGNALFKAGDTVEAAKKYELAVLKFGDWYAECFATDEERTMVHAVKLRAHLNLAACSFKLGNFQHVIVHCTSVLEHEGRNAAAMNAKAFFRRGASHAELGDLEQARSDLKRALELSPADAAVRRALQRLQARRDEYASAQREMTRRMLAGDLGAPSDDAHAATAVEDMAQEILDAGDREHEVTYDNDEPQQEASEAGDDEDEDEDDREREGADAMDERVARILDEIEEQTRGAAPVEHGRDAARVPVEAAPDGRWTWSTRSLLAFGAAWALAGALLTSVVLR